MRTFHDFEVGDLIRPAPVLVSRGEILDFARRYDAIGAGWMPGDAGPATPVASPLLVATLVLGALFRELKALDTGLLGAPQIDGLRLPAPVRAQDRLDIVGEVIARQLEPDGTGRLLVALRTRTGRGTPALVAEVALPVLATARVRILEKAATDG
ncbi:MAG: hypothetical protein NZM40_05160 [Sphingomonadaceae bacterium]|nr:hypothetical protein [Sphingomonadaceae bacterium]